MKEIADAELARIRVRAADAGRGYYQPHMIVEQLARDIARLVVEVERLRTDLQSIADFEPSRMTDLGAYVQIAEHARTTAREAVAKATGAEATG